MFILILFAFLAGIVTILSPCILPVLPIVLSGSLGNSKARPFGIVTGFILSFTFFTLALSTIIKLTGLPPNLLRNVSIVIIFIFGLTLLLPSFQSLTVKLFSKLTALAPKGNSNNGFLSGIVLGASLGIVWTPCVGPIIASVITLAATSNVNLETVFITLAYSIGTAIPMFLIILGGKKALSKVPWITKNTERIQKAFGFVMILLALALYFGLDIRFQNYILQKFPGYGNGLTQIENNSAVTKQLNQIRNTGNQILFNGNQNAPELVAGGKWFNSSPLTISSLRGKVILLDFWTYTCVNCIRTLPHIEAWYEKYHDKGLVVIGVHTPEFEFEKDPNNVQKALINLDVKYPVMQDNDYSTWNAYGNQYWPEEYLIDSKGMIADNHIGEGDYAKTETTIQKLLTQAGYKVNNSMTNIPDQTPTSNLSPESYLGSQRMEFKYPYGSVGNGNQTFTLPDNLPLNSFAFGGSWTITDGYAVTGNKAFLEYNFYADKVFLVIRPGNATGNPSVKVSIDGKEMNSLNAGVDVKNGVVNITVDKLYNLVDLKGKVESHVLKLEFNNPGIQVYAFTFG